ncbi:hypothetical protein AB1Y20_001234 [Prymnesium parvum]|uniref:Uncharacterized protein n=1 Tax=Prymnesium parvum TaxID=97485 RepID=A0AB34K7K5_PRYPA
MLVLGIVPLWLLPSAQPRLGKVRSPPPAAVAAPVERDEWGNYLYRPALDTTPRAIVHFLGGAFVGAAPQLCYSELLERLASEGYVVVATPYELKFDYLRLCEEVLRRTEPSHQQLCEEFGDLPLVGVGHSCGALLHVIATSIFRTTGGFADIPRKANVLISFNNKRASDAVPFFSALVTPAASSLLQLEKGVPLAVTQAILRARTQLKLIATGGNKQEGKPPGLADGRAKELASLAVQTLPIIEQIVPILREIDSGCKEFSPTPSDTREAVALLYNSDNTLILRFDQDTIDESPQLAAMMQGVSGVRMQVLPGSHVTPLTVRIVELPELEDVFFLPEILAPARDLQFNATCTLVAQYLDSVLQ